MSLTNPEMQSWIQRMVEEYLNCSDRTEALALIQETCDAFRREKDLNTSWIQPWLTRVVAGYEKRGGKKRRGH
jgi:hypothetical protein